MRSFAQGVGFLTICGAESTVNARFRAVFLLVSSRFLPLFDRLQPFLAGVKFKETFYFKRLAGSDPPLPRDKCDIL
jgi:hypothetical protein